MTTKIPAIVTPDIQDTTGAGDAYRAGVLKALIDGYSLEI
jgi:sugar/nucleoside kinase (ribokinase family)